MIEAGAGRATPSDEIDDGVSLRYLTRLGHRVEAGQELGRLYLREDDPSLAAAFLNCFEIGDEVSPAPLILERIAPAEAD
jgi:thymidine phosphorylase